MEFDNCLDEVKQILIENTKFIKSLETCCNGRFADEIQKLLDENMKQRLEHGEKLIEMKAHQKRVDAMLQQASNEANTVEELEQIYEKLEKKEAEKRLNVKQTAEYKKFKTEMEKHSNSNATNAPDDDHAVEVLVTGNRFVSMHDPWSKAIMTNPVRNIKCGHHYDRDTVTALLQSTSAAVRCPVVGCPNKAYIQLQHLEADRALHAEILEYVAEQKAQESSEDEA